MKPDRTASNVTMKAGPVVLPAILGAVVCGLFAAAVARAAEGPRETLELQKARDAKVAVIMARKHYDPAQISLADLPAYDPRLREFMRYVLSRDAQDLLRRDTNMLPLTAQQIHEQLKKFQ
jgi:phosphate transport system substrate-binding protein